MANKTTTDAPVAKRKDLSNHKDKIEYKSLMFPDNGGMYVQTFYCIPGDAIAYKKTTIVPVVYLTQPNVDGEQYATLDDNDNIKVTARDEAWQERITSNQAELDEVLNSFGAKLQSEAI